MAFGTLIRSLRKRSEHKGLVDRVREDIDSAKENGYDFFGDPLQAGMTDRDIARDLTDCTTGYDDVGYGALVAAIATVRKERRG